MTQPITFAIPKGRILDEALPLLAAAGIVPDDAFFDPKCRALVFATNDRQVRLIRVRAFDVATFVAHGAAQLGIVGSDVIDEFAYPELYAPVDLGIGQCRISLAAPAGTGAPGAGASHVRVATKYPRITQRYFAQTAIQAECIKLNGAMEIAPMLGIASHIVDLVSSGQTLRENGLDEVAVIAPVSARLIVNRGAMKQRAEELPAMVDRFRAIRPMQGTADAA